MAMPDFLRFMAPEMVPWGMPSCGLLRSRFFAASTNVSGPVVVSLWSRCGLVVVPPLYYNSPFKSLDVVSLWSRFSKLPPMSATF